MPQMLAEPSAITRSGRAWRSAPATTWGRKCPTTWRAATGAGWRALRMLPARAAVPTRADGPRLFRTLRAADPLAAVGRVGLGVVHHHVDPAAALRRRAGVVHHQVVARHLAAAADGDGLAEAVRRDRVLVGAGPEAGDG